MRKPQRTAVTALTVLSATMLAGCGLFKSSGISGRYEPNDPNRTADSVVAVVTNSTYFNATDLSDKATFRATLYDKDHRQFFGPEVLLEGEAVTTSTVGDDRTTVYAKTDLPYAGGQTWTMSVQGTTATTPPAPAPLKITSPAAATDDKGDTLVYFNAEPGQPVTITWTGGDPGEPVYIILYGSPDKKGARRLFVSDNAALSPSDPTNFGKPIPNNGSFTIPAEVTERIASGGSRTVTLFDNPNKKGSGVNLLQVSVLQRGETISGPVRFAVSTVGAAAAGVTAYK